MKLSNKTKKVVLAGLVCAMPLSLLAGHGHDDDDRGDRDDNYKKEFVKKGVNYIFEGTLESKPKGTLSGVWKISGKNITVTDETVIYQEKVPFKKGDEIYVAAKREGSKIIAIELEQDD